MTPRDVGAPGAATNIDFPERTCPACGLRLVEAFGHLYHVDVWGEIIGGDQSCRWPATHCAECGGPLEGWAGEHHSPDCEAQSGY